MVAIAYLSVVLVWATTPLAIKWSNSSLSFIEAISLRTLLSLAVCWLVLVAMRKPLIRRKQDWNVFLAGSLSLFPNMLIVYWSAQYIPSGLIAVVFGFYPFMVGFFSLFLLKENIFTPQRLVAMMIAISGLVVINLGQLHLGGNAVLGVLGVLTSTMLFGLSSVLIKRIGTHVEPIRQITGSLVLAAPGFLLMWILMDGHFPTSIDSRSAIGVAYLVIAGTLFGGTLFYFVLKHCSVASVGMITFITPVLAIVIGVLIDNETLTDETIIGCLLVIFSLAIYQDVFRFIAKRLRNLRNVSQVPTVEESPKTPP